MGGCWVAFCKGDGLLGGRSGGSGCLGSRIWALDLVAEFLIIWESGA